MNTSTWMGPFGSFCAVAAEIEELELDGLVACDSLAELAAAALAFEVNGLSFFIGFAGGNVVSHQQSNFAANGG